MNTLDTINQLNFRFATIEAAKEYMANPSAIPGSPHWKRLQELSVPPYIKTQGKIQRNPEYDDAPYEIQIVMLEGPKKGIPSPVAPHKSQAWAFVNRA